MLRLLETQLREELGSLQLAYLNAIESPRFSVAAPAALTATMLSKFRYPQVTLDMLCSQPSCPICNEDFEIKTQINHSCLQSTCDLILTLTCGVDSTFILSSVVCALMFQP